MEHAYSVLTHPLALFAKHQILICVTTADKDIFKQIMVSAKLVQAIALLVLLLLIVKLASIR